MKFWNLAWLYLAISDVEAQIMFSVCLDYRGKCLIVQQLL